MAGERIRDHFCDGRRSKHADLHGGDGGIREKRVDFGRDERGRRQVDIEHTLRVLHGQGGDRSQTIAAKCGKSLDVGLNAGSPARVGTRNG